MKRLLIASLLGSMAFAASAQTAAPAETDPAPVQTQVETQGDVATETRADASAITALDAQARTQRDADRNCIRYTGTRISSRKRDGGDCVIASGRVYSREDLDRTGQTDIADALRMLDPAIY